MAYTPPAFSKYKFNAPPANPVGPWTLVIVTHAGTTDSKREESTPGQWASYSQVVDEIHSLIQIYANEYDRGVLSATAIRGNERVEMISKGADVPWFK